VSQIDSSILEQRRDLGVVARSLVDGVLRLVVPVSGSSNDEGGVGNVLEGVGSRLKEDATKSEDARDERSARALPPFLIPPSHPPSSLHKLYRNEERAYQIDDLLEPNLNLAVSEVREGFRVVDEFGELSLPHLGSPVSEDKEESVDGVGLS